MLSIRLNDARTGSSRSHAVRQGHVVANAGFSQQIAVWPGGLDLAPDALDEGPEVLVFVAVLIDTVDGALARKIRVKEVLPDVDGRMLDYVIDFTNDVIVPTLLVYAAGLVPSSIRLICCGAMLLVSCYHYTNLKAITDDFRFRGFPAMWNFVVFYIFVLELDPIWNVVIIAVFCFLHFIPIDFIYPTRTIRLKKLTFSLVLVIAVVNLTILIQHPLRNTALLAASLAIVGYLMAISLYQTYLSHRST